MVSDSLVAPRDPILLKPPCGFPGCRLDRYAIPSHELSLLGVSAIDTATVDLHRLPESHTVGVDLEAELPRGRDHEEWWLAGELRAGLHLVPLQVDEPGQEVGEGLPAPGLRDPNDVPPSDVFTSGQPSIYEAWL